MKKTSVLLILLCLFSLSVYAQKTEPTKEAAVLKTPAEATIEINFLSLPGKADSKSTWQLSYELRIISQTEYSKTDKLKNMSLSGEKVGELIFKDSFKKENLSKDANREAVLKIPLSKEIQEKLQKQTETPQVFLFYCSAVIFDAKLKKNIIVPLNWIWLYKIYPDANFGMEFQIVEEATESGYSYSKKTFVPEKLPQGYYMIRPSSEER